MHGILPKIQKLGALLIAVTPEKPDDALTLSEKLNLSFPVLSDVGGKVMKDYKISWQLPDDLKEQYLQILKKDFKLHNNGAGWVLPIPATFIIDKKGKIRHRYVNPDFKKRMELTEIIEVLTTLNGEA